MTKKSKQQLFNFNCLPNFQKELDLYGVDNSAYRYKYYVDMLLNICVSIFQWENLPKTVDPFILEKTLLLSGKCVYFKDDVIGDIVLPVEADANNNIFNEPKRRVAYSWNTFFHKQLDDSNSVMIYNNVMRTSEILDIYETAKKLYTINSARTSNINAQKTPILIICDERNRLTMENIYEKYNNNTPVIFSYDDFNPNDKFNVFKTDAPYTADKLFQLEQNELNSFLARMGVCSLSETKRERVITSEINALNGGAYTMRLSRLNARKQACKKINEMFGTEIDVHFNDFLNLEGGASEWDTQSEFNEL